MAKVVTLKAGVKKEGDARGKEDISAAIKDLEEAILKNPLAEKVYNRLMILYRKEKNYKKELRLINAAIKAFENLYKSGKPGSKKIAEISEKLNRAFGLTDKKGNVINELGPIAAWKKRKITVEKRIK